MFFDGVVLLAIVLSQLLNTIFLFLLGAGSFSEPRTIFRMENFEVGLRDVRKL